MKEQEEKQLEQEDDEMIYTYARENERKVKYNYTYSSAKKSLVASELAHHKKSFIASSSSLLSPIPVSLFTSTSPLPLSPPLSPALIKRSFRTIDTHSRTSDENVRRHRLQIIPSPPPPPPSSSPVQKPFRMNRNTDDCGDRRSNSKNSTLDHSKILDISKPKTNVSTLPRLSQTSSKRNMNSNTRQPIRIVNSLQALGSLNERSFIPLVNRKSIINSPPMTNLVGQLSVDKSSHSRSSSTTNTVYRIRPQQQPSSSSFLPKDQQKRQHKKF